MENKEYSKIFTDGSKHYPARQAVLTDKLQPGVYKPHLHPMTGEFTHFESINTNHDQIIDLPSEEYDAIVKEFEYFLTPECNEAFKRYGFVYKRSTLLHGLPGTGKTMLVNRLSKKVIETGGIILLADNPSALVGAYKVLDQIQPDTKVMVIFEEFDEVVDDYEGILLNLLDGEIQKNNIIYVATTNFIQHIPARLRRPGRFSSVVEVKYPSAATRKAFLQKKTDLNESNLNFWVEQTQDFSIDELKETILSVMCLKQPLDNVINRIRNNKAQISASEIVDEQENAMDALNSIFGLGSVARNSNKSRR